MSTQYFDFEKPIAELEKALLEAEERAAGGDEAAEKRAGQIRRRLEKTRADVYRKMTSWERVQFARAKDRPRSLDYITGMCTDFVELHGDRRFADDEAVICGTARFDGRPVAVIGQQKGKDTKENIRRNFGMMNPEGYRKAMRIMNMASKFGMPILIFIDTPGAYPGIGGEERGQAEAIAANIRDMFALEVPVICIIIGEGASGGALGVGVGDRVLMLENAWYCVISPEGCAAILWKDRAMAPRAADALKLTAPDLLKLGVIDEIVPEPLGGAHRFPEETMKNLSGVVARHLKELSELALEKLQEGRLTKYRTMGVFTGG